jgi:hypothetical protein
MRYDVISADCHVDLCWLPPELFVENAAADLRSRMPYVTEGPTGRVWTTKRPTHPIDAAIAEVKRVAKRGVLRGLDIAATSLLICSMIGRGVPAGAIRACAA